MSDEQASPGRKRALWIVLALIVVVGAAVGVIVLASRNDSGVTNGQAQAISTTSSSSTPSSASTTPPGTDSATNSSAASTTQTAAATTASSATTVKVLTTKPPTPKPTLAVTSVKASANPYPCSTSPQLTISWSTTLADSVTVGITDPNPFEQNLPPTGSLDVPFTGCSNGQGKVTYYIVAKKAGSADVIRSITVNAGT
jgi:cytoskeletal protein RodZ